MLKVLENVKDREQVASGEDSHEAEEFSELEITPERQEPEIGKDLLNLYMDEVGYTPLLSVDETKMLASQIEDGKHLIRLEKDWIAGHGTQPSAVELLLDLVKRFTRARLLFETLCQYLRVPSRGSIAEKVSHPDLRRAIDGSIDQHLSSAVAGITGADQTTVEKNMIGLSLDSRLIPWHTVGEASRKSSVARFDEVLHSPEFRDKLEAHRSQIVKHFEQIGERARRATDHMIQANLRLVIKVAKGRIGWGVPISDLIQEGNIGLMQAVQKFDHRRGHRFSTYAIPWIWQAINRAVDDQSRIVRLPGHVVELSLIHI